MCRSFSGALMQGKRRVLLLLFTFCYIHFSPAQIDEKTIGKFLKNPGHSLDKDDFVIVDSDELLSFDSVEYVRPLLSRYFILKQKSNHFNKERIIGVANNEWKYSPSLLKTQTGKVQLKDQWWKEGVVISTLDRSQLEEHLRARNIPFIESSLSNSLVAFPRQWEDVSHIVKLASVTFVDRRRITPSEETLNSFHDLSVNGISYAHHKLPHLDGQSLNISIRERTVDKTDIDLKNRIIDSPLEDALISLHANQMATIIAGGGNSSPDSRGVVSAAKVTSASFVSPFPDPSSYYQENGIAVQNHSYGYTIENYYGAEAREYDLMINVNPHLVHVFSSGNRGMDISTNGSFAGIQGYANLTGNMKHAKNVLVVGGHYKDYEVDERNSRGPAFDGRIKPEVVAYGPEGTSDAAAYVSGVVALLQHAYRDANGELPSVPLIKSSLVCTADDIYREGLDHVTGYGAVNAYRALNLIHKNLFYNHDLSTEDESKSYSVNIPENVSRLRVALCWNDPAAEAGASTALVNDLDLMVHSDGNFYAPWILNTEASEEKLSALPTRGQDKLNNIEFVSIDSPAAGDYNIVVSAADLKSNQSYSLVYYIDTLKTFEWIYPVSSDQVFAGEPIHLRWNTTYTGATDIYVSIDDGSYEKIISAAELDRRFATWQLPPNPGEVKFRIMLDGTEYVSEPLKTSLAVSYDVAFYCEEESMLHWNKRDADRYVLYNLGMAYMEPVGEISDTSFVFRNTEYSPYFAIAASRNGKTGKRTLTYDYRRLGVNCFYRSFSAQVTTDKVTALTLILGTTYQVSKIVFEKERDGQFVAISDASVEGELSYSFNDPDLNGGYQMYRAAIHMLDGSVIHTDVASILYADDSTFIVFPNPVSPSTQSLKLLSDGNDLVFELCDTNGKTVLTEDIFGTLFEVSVDLPAGLYLFRFWRAGTVVETGRIIVGGR
jgi:hypothetical protein